MAESVVPWQEMHPLLLTGCARRHTAASIGKHNLPNRNMPVTDYNTRELFVLRKRHRGFIGPRWELPPARAL